MAGNHIVKTFDQELERLKDGIVQMGNGCLEQLAATVRALKTRDCKLAMKIVAEDRNVNELQRQVERMTVNLLAMRQPLAKDLRVVLGSLKIASDLERIADYAANVAKDIHYLDGKRMDEAVEKILAMADRASAMLKGALEAFEESDAEKAVAVWKIDAEINRHYEELFVQLRKAMTAEPGNVEQPTALLFMGRCCERIGDHIKNVAEQVHYIAAGSSHIAERIDSECRVETDGVG
jgi:phosphate transport system protein